MRFLVSLCVGCCAVWAQTANPFAGDSRAVAAGKVLFRVHCSSCHGRQAQGGNAPDLARGSFSVGDQDSDLFRTISEGVTGTEMASYSRLGADNIWRLVTFVRSMSHSEAPVAGDAARGDALFWGKGGCGNCHAVGNRGNRMGPDLSRVGQQLSLENLRESVVSPSSDIVPGYSGVTVVLRDGKTVRGIQKALDDFSVVLVDFSGKLYTYDRSDVRSVTRDTQSLMPEYGKALTSAELDDLLAYLFTLGRTGVRR